MEESSTTTWLGNEPSNWGTNSQPARTSEILKACTPEKPVLRAQTTTPQGPQTPYKGVRVPTYPNHIIIFWHPTIPGSVTKKAHTPETRHVCE
ncbi:unnamed protein product [Prunus armeniaca]